MFRCVRVHCWIPLNITKHWYALLEWPEWPIVTMSENMPIRFPVVSLVWPPSFTWFQLIFIELLIFENGSFFLYRVTHKFCHNFPPLLFANQWTHSDEILICCSWGFIDNISLSLFWLLKHFYKSELQKKILTHDVARNFFQKFPDAQFLIPANIQRKILIRRWSRRRIW